ncbi:sporulation protein YqfD [Bacillus sp. 03113]|uniref:sporulation protein YqfD n=1 Tax=Bacillus sp. 03113 TaxID=2578211 RepID=UPI0011429E4E|nr:sporulation protein YqfD [Bacillus sp. 03113]
MKNQWIEFYNGIVTVKVTGKAIERFLNKLIRNGINIWNVKRLDSSAISFDMRLKDIKKIRLTVRGSDCKLEFIGRKGIPFLLKRVIRNSGFLFGFILFLGIILLLSNIVWGIEIKGANPATEHQIRKELNKMDIKVGKLQFFTDNVEGIQKELTNRIEAITWVGVELIGTTYHFQVVEKNEPPKPEYVGPRHLIATKKAHIEQIQVETGQPVVQINDYVRPGQLLVSGFIGSEGKIKKIAAKGKIYGQTWYETKVDLPLKSTFKVLNGNEEQKVFIKIRKIKLHIWGFKKIIYKQYEVEENWTPIKFLKWELPVSVGNKVYRESEQVTREYGDQEAIKFAKQYARSDLLSQLPDDAKIKDEKILQRSIDNGKVSISILFQIIEDIAEGQPIIQGDTE